MEYTNPRPHFQGAPRKKRHTGSGRAACSPFFFQAGPGCPFWAGRGRPLPHPRPEPTFPVSFLIVRSSPKAGCFLRFDRKESGAKSFLVRYKGSQVYFLWTVSIISTRFVPSFLISFSQFPTFTQPRREGGATPRGFCGRWPAPHNPMAPSGAKDVRKEVLV